MSCVFILHLEHSCFPRRVNSSILYAFSLATLYSACSEPVPQLSTYSIGR